MAVTIHSSSIVERGAELADGVEVGPFCTVGPKVRLGEGVRLVSHISVAGNTSVGARTVIYPNSSLGHPPQDLKFKGEDTRLIVGADNVIREGVTMHLGTVTGRSQTVVGDKNFFMANSHVGHDCILGNNVVIGNNTALGGVTQIDDFVIFGGNSAVHQFGRIGKYAFIGGCAPVVGDVIPFGMVDNHGRLHGLNLVGLKRRGFKREAINALRAMYRHVFLGEGNFEERVTEAAATYGDLPEAMMIIDFINAGEKRGLCLPGPQ
ncbi:MAG TPA: acyl-ACP--UDP-N-acetylglucosamine O-acyltransferase [Hyphomonadaceae bacterium]|jgi:UDP-N-acetylglucosamine acyltransferase|nr:acyl-ACP--UDP-N-acetylglucosamine O-acyltransferase [Hyphomonadaceae bacterium]